MLSETLVHHALSVLLDVDEEDLRSDLTLAELQGWDSVNALRVLVYLERQHGEPLNYDVFMAAKTVRDLCKAASSETRRVGAQP